MGVRIASGLCPSPARHNLNVAGAVNLPWGFKLSVILSMIGASPVESDHHGYRPQWRRECQLSSVGSVFDLPAVASTVAAGKSQMAAAADSFNRSAGKKGPQRYFNAFQIAS